jgi:plastin-1
MQRRESISIETDFWFGANTFQARETIKNVNVDSSGRLEVEDWVQLHSLLKAGKSQPVYVPFQ